MTTQENTRIGPRRLPRPLTGPRNDKPWVLAMTKKGKGLAMTNSRRPPFPIRHCEEERFLSRRGNLWYPGTVRTRMRGTQKRDCHAPLRGARNDRGCGLSLRGGASFALTKQSLVPKDSTNENEETPKERLPRTTSWCSQ